MEGESESTSRCDQIEKVSHEKSARSVGQMWEGWRAGVLIGAIITSLVFITNLVILVWASAHSIAEDGNVVTLYEGTRAEADRIFTWTHLGINLLSTLLLSASSACMQCLAAPTREEVDKAHSCGRWLDIGIPSLKNLRWITRWRLSLWVFLFLASIPIHLFYNSVIFSTITANDYYEILVAENFLDGGPWDTNGLMDNSQAQHLQESLNSLVKLDNADCIKAYFTSLVSDYQNVLLVTSHQNRSDSILAIHPQSFGALQGGLCVPSVDGFFCNRQLGPADPSNWILEVISPSLAVTPFSSLDDNSGNTVVVDYCLVELTPVPCTIGLSRAMLGIVVICNGIKLLCLISTLIIAEKHPLITIGDAIASFLESADPRVWHLPLSVMQIRSMEYGMQWLAIPSQRWNPVSHYWFAAASKRRWLVTGLSFTLLWLTSLIILVKMWIGINGAFDAWSQSFGVLNYDSFLGFSSDLSLTSSIVLANTPQILVSLFYLAYNTLLTAMLLTAEYMSFSSVRKSLRVSTRPQGAQRSTYYLQLPYRYSLPLLVSFALLHWFLSQSLFHARVAIINTTGEASYLNGCGWSAVGMLAAVVLCGVILLALFALGFRRFDSGMPLAGSCSVAIGAACHRAEDQEGPSIVFEELMYGVLYDKRGQEANFDHDDDDGNFDNHQIPRENSGEVTIRRVGFSAKAVSPLVRDMIYD